MLLELDTLEVLHLIETPAALADKVCDCVEALKEAAKHAFLALLPADISAALPVKVRSAIAAGNFPDAVNMLHAHLGLQQARQALTAAHSLLGS